MKKFFYTLLVALFAFSFTSCEKDDSKDASIVGDWNLDYLLVNTVDDMEMQNQKEYYPGYMNVYENNTLMFALYDPSSRMWGEWILNGNKFVVKLREYDGAGGGSVPDDEMYKESFVIEKLTKTELILKRPIIDDHNQEIGSYDYHCTRK